MGTHTRILKKYNRRYSKRYSKKSKRHTRKNIYSKTYKKIQKGGFLCKKVTAELETTKTELETTKTKLQMANIRLKDAETALKTAKAELDEVMGYNITHIEKNNSLKSEIFNLEKDLDKLKEKLKEQTSPTDEEIEAVILDENDMEKINDTLSSSYSNNADSSGFSPSNFSEELEKYKKKNIEIVTKEYKKEKLMKEKLMKEKLMESRPA